MTDGNKETYQNQNHYNQNLNNNKNHKNMSDYTCNNEEVICIDDFYHDGNKNRSELLKNR